jgi:hypothetical protein
VTEARKDDARLSLDVSHLLMESHVTGDELVVLDGHPDDRDLRAAVTVESGQMNQGGGSDEVANALGDRRHAG